MHIFTATTLQATKAGLGTTRKSRQCVQSYSFPNILLDGWEGLKAYKFEKWHSKSAKKLYMYKVCLSLVYKPVYSCKTTCLAEFGNAGQAWCTYSAIHHKDYSV